MLRPLIGLAVLALPLLGVGCGTLLSLSDRNGEHYLASHCDCEVLKIAVAPSPDARFTLGPVLALPWVLCWGTDLAVSLTLSLIHI